MSARNFLLIAGLALSGCSSTQPYTGEKVTQSSIASGGTVTQLESRSVLPSGGLAGSDAFVAEFTAPVVALDKKSRIVSFLPADGKRVDVKAGPEVRNFDQIKVGDVVRLVYFESIDFESREPTREEWAVSNQQALVAGRTPKGSSPGALVGAGRKTVLVVDAIDESVGTVRFKSGSELLTVKAKYPQNLKMIKPGQPVVVTTTEMVAASIEPLS